MAADCRRRLSLRAGDGEVQGTAIEMGGRMTVTTRV
jgi:acetamidase/formamidase